MRMRPYTRRLGGWIALWALACTALLPAFAQILRVETSPAWFEVCTPAGTRLVATGDDGTGPHRSPGTLQFDHCPYCIWQHAVAALPTSLPRLVLLPLSFGLPERFLSAPRTAFAWTAAQPRGPPLPY